MVVHPVGFLVALAVAIVFSLPKMIGMSVLYSTVFQLIGTIQSAFAEGMQSLAQYSQSVNANISSMMSALMQLRNAFAAAFEPILSVVAPYLATFISWLAKAINMLGQFIAGTDRQRVCGTG